LGRRLVAENKEVRGSLQAALTPRARLAYLAIRIHALGPRPLYELFRELEAGAPLIERLERYAALFPLADFILEHGGDRLPTLRSIPGGRDDAP
jgi:hypothetical protein